MINKIFKTVPVYLASSIKNKLIFTFIIILLVSIFVVGQVSYQTAKNKISKEITQSTSESIKLLNNLLTSTITSSMNNVDNLSKNIHASLYAGNGSTTLKNYLDAFQNTHPEISSTYLGTNTGLTFVSPYQKIAGDYDPRSRPWYQDAIKNKGKVYITEPYLQMDNTTNKPTGNVIVSIVKVVSDGSGVIGVDLNLSEISNSTKKVKFGQKGYAVIMDKQAKALVHPAVKPGTEITDDWARQVLSKESGELDYTYEDQENKMMFITNHATGWKLIGIMNKEEIDQKASSINQRIYAVMMFSILFGSIFIYFVIRSIVHPLSILVNATEKISQGDFSQKVTLQRKDEVGKLADTFNRMSEELRRMIHNLLEKSETLAASSEELMASTEQTNQASNHIAFAMQEVAAGTEQQTSSIDISSKAIHVMSSGMKQIVENAEDMNRLAKQASEKSLEGGKIVQTAASQMNNIGSKVYQLSEVVKELGIHSEEIGKITKVITDISAQTNLLALNATIEAARAGEHGQGFSVVANEVRKLAEKSAQSAQQISSLITMIQEKTNIAVESMDFVTYEVSEGNSIVSIAGKVFNDIQSSINEVNNQIEQVFLATKEMTEESQKVFYSIDAISEVVEKTSSGIQSVSAATEEQLATMDEISASASSLSGMAEELQGLISKFKI
jgi:methyl-accepting chemotaxis protein